MKQMRMCVCRFDEHLLSARENAVACFLGFEQELRVAQRFRVSCRINLNQDEIRDGDCGIYVLVAIHSGSFGLSRAKAVPLAC